MYGVKSYVVSRRTREVGIRIAISAHPRALLWQVLREGGRITTIGIVIGLLLTVGAGQFLQGILETIAEGPQRGSPCDRRPIQLAALLLEMTAEVVLRRW